MALYAVLCPLFKAPNLRITVSPGSRNPFPLPPAISSMVISPFSSTGALSTILKASVQLSFPLSEISTINSTVSWSGTNSSTSKAKSFIVPAVDPAAILPYAP